MKAPPPKGKKSKRPIRVSMIGVVAAMGVLLLVNLLLPTNPPGAIPYSEFKNKLRLGEFSSVWITERRVFGQVSVSEAGPVEAPAPSWWPGPRDRVSALRPADDRDFIPLLDQSGVRYEIQMESTPLGDFLRTWMFPLLLMVFVWWIILRRMGPGPEVMTFGRNKARLHADTDLKTTFSDVAGQDEAKEELKEVIDFLSFPKKFTSLGGKLPKGILLVGPPGTGKTLLARAVAGEAKVPFFNISGSDFVEMFVGVGASRVRDLFKQAKAKAPCIVFIDELDALGKARGINPIGGHDEREQTLNQLLVEMDGFQSQAGVIIMAATNRPEILDPALLRPGRFDRNVLVGRPNVKERRAILELHAKGVKKSPGVNMETIAQRTPGLTGADLANVVNEAALLAARRDKPSVEMKDFEDSVDRILTGLEKKTNVIGKKEKEIVAYHEAGHAVVAALTDRADPVHKITIIPRGIGALGFTLQLPSEDRHLIMRSELLGRVDILLGGRVAEQVVFGDVSTGAADDLQRATDIVRSMVTRYGMGKTLGPVVIEESRQSILGDRADALWPSQRTYSDETARQVDEEVRLILTERLDRVTQLLGDEGKLLSAVVSELLVKETLSGDEFLRIVETHRSSASSSVSGMNTGG